MNTKTMTTPTERAALIAEMRKVAGSYESRRLDALLNQAADMLAADAQQVTVPQSSLSWGWIQSFWQRGIYYLSKAVAA